MALATEQEPRRPALALVSSAHVKASSKLFNLKMAEVASRNKLPHSAGGASRMDATLRDSGAASGAGVGAAASDLSAGAAASSHHATLSSDGQASVIQRMDAVVAAAADNCHAPTLQGQDGGSRMQDTEAHAVPSDWLKPLRLTKSKKKQVKGDVMLMTIKNMMWGQLCSSDWKVWVTGAGVREANHTQQQPIAQLATPQLRFNLALSGKDPQVCAAPMHTDIHVSIS